MRGFELWMSGARDNHSDHRPIFFVSVFARTRGPQDDCSNKRERKGRNVSSGEDDFLISHRCPC